MEGNLPNKKPSSQRKLTTLLKWWCDMVWRLPGHCQSDLTFKKRCVQKSSAIYTPDVEQLAPFQAMTVGRWSFPFGVAYFQGLLLLKFQGVYPGSPFGPNCLKNYVSPWKVMGSIPVRNQPPNSLLQMDFRGFFIDFYDFHISYCKPPASQKERWSYVCTCWTFFGESSFSQIR